MKTISRYIMTLALLLTAVGGAWAEELTVYDGTGANTYVPVYGFYADAYLKCQTVYPATELAAMAGNSINSITYYATSPASKAWGATFQVHVIEVADATISNFNDLSTATLVYEGTLDGTQSTMAIPFTTPYNYQGGNLLVSVSLTTTGNYEAITWGGETVEGASVQGYSYSSFDAISATQRNFLPKTTFTYGPSNVDVTTDAASEQDLFTEAKFNMPAFDAMVNYMLVRDMTVDVDATIADRIRIKKENNVYVVVTDGQLTPAVSDKISGTAVAMTATTDYTAQLQKKTEGDTPTWADATTLSVGTFRYVITGTGLYDGNITTNEFQLFEGYEVTIPAGEYATYFKDEALYVENENAQLYTISSVTESEAVLSSAIEVAPAETPLLVYNKSEQDKTFLLIPTTDKTPDNVTAATQFVGTLEATTIPASATGADNYALNGYAFVWVKTAIPVAANKCWLHIASQPAGARGNTRSITGGNETTGIDAIENVTIDNEGWYDLQGRKLQAKPNRGGIYIHNGKKVIVR